MEEKSDEGSSTSSHGSQQESFAQILLTSLKRHPGKSIAQVEVETGRELTYSHLSRLSLSAVQGLKSLGVDESSIIAVVSFNSQESHIISLATIFIAATLAPVDPAITIEEMVHFFENLHPSVIYTEGGKTLRKVETALAILGVNPTIIVSGKERPPYTSFQSLLLPTDPDFRPRVSDVEEHVALIMHTSGTCGLPKAVMITDAYLIYNCTMSSGKSTNVSVLVTSPIFWFSGIIIFFTSIMEGMYRVFLRGPAKEIDIYRTIQSHKIAIWFTTPNTLMSMTYSQNEGSYNLNSLQMVIVGGAPLLAESQHRIQRELFRNRISIYQAYGMTEIGGVTASLPGSNKPGSVGKVKPGISCKVVDIDTGETVGAGMRGELCLKSLFFMKGYFNNLQGTIEAYDKDGWFHTEDYGYIDEEGYIFVLDRLSDLIRYKHYQIPVVELEDVIIAHPSVKDVAVFGLPHLEDGSHAAAFAVAHLSLSESQLLDYVGERVPEYKQLRGGVRFVDFIPRTPTGKTRRFAIRDQVLAELTGMYFL